jgi:hypothetical protein
MAADVNWLNTIIFLKHRWGERAKIVYSYNTTICHRSTQRFATLVWQ